MKNNKSNLLSLIDSLILEELSIDEPKGGTLGKVAFAPERTDNVVNEPNTPEEEEIFQALDKHFFDNESEELEQFAPKLLSLVKSNKYQKVLKPNPGIAYRILSDVSLSLGSKILGVSPKDINSKANKAIYSPTGVKVNSPVQKLQSWTMVPDASRFANLDGSYGAPSEGDGRLYILMRANVPDSGKFFLNSNIVDVIPIFPNENEVISYGPVKLSGASFYYVKDDKSKKTIKVSNKQIIQMLIDSLTSG